jgi:hypothetical protein
MATPFPRLTPPHFASPANLRFAYSGWQNVSYLNTLDEIRAKIIKKDLNIDKR